MENVLESMQSGLMMQMVTTVRVVYAVCYVMMTKYIEGLLVQLIIGTTTQVKKLILEHFQFLILNY